MARDKLGIDNLPILFMGFSAGAYLSMTVARILREEFPGRVGVVAVGHTLFLSERMEQSTAPGIVAIGENECKYIPYSENLDGSGCGSYINLGDLAGGHLFDEIGASHCFGGCVGSTGQAGHLSRTMTRCLVLEATDA